MLTIACPDEAATERLGAQLWRTCVAAGSLAGERPSEHPILVLLSGTLGAGKTTLVRGALRAAGLSGAVRSPTFTLVEVYAFPPVTVYHWDLYRLAEGASLDALGFRDYLHSGAVLFIEWPERCPALFEQHALGVRLQADGASRTATLTFGRRDCDRMTPELLAQWGHADTP